MGCDIHIVLEKQLDDGTWLGLHNFNSLPDYKRSYSFPIATERNYQRFNLLAGVRGEDGRKPGGVPGSASELSKHLIDKWGFDGHNHSYMSLEEAGDIFRVTTPSAVGRYADKNYVPHPSYEYFGVDMESDPGVYRIVFWFDN